MPYDQAGAVGPPSGHFCLYLVNIYKKSMMDKCIFVYLYDKCILYEL